MTSPHVAAERETSLDMEGSCEYVNVFTLDAKLLAGSQHSEGPTTGHLDTGFSWFPWV